MPHLFQQLQRIIDTTVWRWARRCLLGLAVLFALSSTWYLVVADGWADLLLGRMHRQAKRVFIPPNDITTVEISLLKSIDGRSQIGTFPIKPYSGAWATAPVYDVLVLTGKDLDLFIDRWSSQSLDYDRQALCHEPPYGFRFFRGESLLLETSVCWKCSNFSVDVIPGMSTWYGFDANDEAARELFDFCYQRLPFPRSDPEGGDPTGRTRKDLSAPEPLEP